MTKEERIQKAMELRAQGYNCAQSVVLAFPDKTGIDMDTAARCCNALGTGVAASGEICGVANGIAIAVGLTLTSHPSEKVHATKLVRPLLGKFSELNGQRVRCSDLKGKEGVRPCNELIAQGISLLDDFFTSQS